MKNFALVTSALALSVSLAGEPAPTIEIRFCPASVVRTYPLESKRELQSLLLQNVAVINHGKAAFDVKEIELELLQGGQVLDIKKLDGKTIHS